MAKRGSLLPHPAFLTFPSAVLPFIFFSQFARSDGLSHFHDLVRCLLVLGNKYVDYVDCSHDFQRNDV